MAAVPAAVLVSGGNRGIGLSICKGLAQKGCRVFMGSRDLAKGEEAKESLGSELAALITVVALDVTSDESIAAAVAAVSMALGSGTSLAGLINNAGGTFGGGLGFSSADNWEATMNLNYLGGCVKMTEAFVPLLDKATGRLVNVSSGAAPTFVSKCSPEYIAKFCDWDTTSPESLMSIYEDAQKIAKGGGGDVDAVTAAFGAGGLGDGAPYHFSKVCAPTRCYSSLLRSPFYTVTATLHLLIPNFMLRLHAHAPVLSRPGRTITFQKMRAHSNNEQSCSENTSRAEQEYLSDGGRHRLTILSLLRVYL